LNPLFHQKLWFKLWFSPPEIPDELFLVNSDFSRKCWTVLLEILGEDGNVVDMVDSFTYLGSLVDRNGRSEAELVRRIAITRNCMASLDCNIWRSSISVSTKIRLYSVYVLPVFLYGAETWTLTKAMTKAMAAKVDAFDQWCQRCILRIHYSQHVTNAEVRCRTGCLPLSGRIGLLGVVLFGQPCPNVGFAPDDDEYKNCYCDCISYRGIQNIINQFTITY